MCCSVLSLFVEYVFSNSAILFKFVTHNSVKIDVAYMCYLFKEILVDVAASQKKV